MAFSKSELDHLFTEAHTHHGWQDRALDEKILRQLYDLIKWAPTCVNGAPMRLLFLQSAEAKEKLVPCLLPKNVEKTRAAPVCAIIAFDTIWYEKLDFLSPHFDYKTAYKSNSALSEATAFRNSAIQGGYLILAARALGLDVGPMSGFNAAKVDEIFFQGTTWKANFLCNIGFGDHSKIYPRAPRLNFEDVCKVV
ncbi:MAG: malonic semialdehyde reductase [Bdellovibrio sp.]|nr:malonic semialdehyde reductase [Bdellovibrio sp.]